MDKMIANKYSFPHLKTGFFLPQVKVFATSLIKDKMPADLHYHDLRHTEIVARAAYEIGSMEGLNEIELEIVQIAAWLHDIGYMSTYMGHEEAGIDIAGDFLSYIGYPKERFEEVKGCIMATKMPQSPENLMQKVICDADMYHLSAADYFDRKELLRKEWAVYMPEFVKPEKWHEVNIKFLTQHTYFTSYGQSVLAEGKNLNLRKLSSLIAA